MVVLLHPHLRKKIGAWRSWLAHLHGVQGVGSSSLLAPTKKKIKMHIGFFARRTLFYNK